MNSTPAACTISFAHARMRMWRLTLGAHACVPVRLHTSASLAIAGEPTRVCNLAPNWRGMGLGVHYKCTRIRRVRALGKPRALTLVLMAEWWRWCRCRWLVRWDNTLCIVLFAKHKFNRTHSHSTSSFVCVRAFSNSPLCVQLSVWTIAHTCIMCVRVRTVYAVLVWTAHPAERRACMGGCVCVCIMQSVLWWVELRDVVHEMQA